MQEENEMSVINELELNMNEALELPEGAPVYIAFKWP